ncbi:MAG: terpene cyclase/mutase family protein [Planctomycetes bacterium]|nr:terpene cyclase/mutase family protein [Planctomycetota bacterium]
MIVPRMFSRDSRVLFLFALALAGTTVSAEEIQGRVVQVSGGTIRVEIDSDVVPTPGDRAVVYYQREGSGKRAVVGEGEVARVEGQIVVVTMDDPASAVQVGQQVESAARARPAEPVPAKHEVPSLFRARLLDDEAKRRLVAEEGGDGTRPTVDLGLAWLSVHQDESRGGWDSDDFQAECETNTCSGRGEEWCDPGLTALALLAFLADGNTPETGRYKDAVKLGVGYLKSIQDSEGCLGPRENSFLYNHAIATQALVEAYAMSGAPELLEPARKAVAFLVAAQNPGKGWRYKPRAGDNDTSVTGWAIVALLDARSAGFEVPPEAFEGARSWIDSATDEESLRTGYISRGDTGARLRDQIGRFATVETSTAISILARLLLGTRRDDPLVYGQGVLLLQSRPAWDPSGGPGGTSTIDFYYWYYGTLAMHQMGWEFWKEWNEKMKTAIVGHQRTDGDECGSWDPIDAWGPSGGRIYATACNVLALETYFRYERVPR